jgi:hypothetical protein
MAGFQTMDRPEPALLELAVNARPDLDRCLVDGVYGALENVLESGAPIPSSFTSSPCPQALRSSGKFGKSLPERNFGIFKSRVPRRVPKARSR